MKNEMKNEIKNLFVYDMNNVGWITPSITKSNIVGNTITMDVNYNDGMDIHKNITISRVSDGYVMTDPGLFTRKFTSAEFLRWEFEYPTSLIQELELLPVGTNNQMEFFDTQKAFNYQTSFFQSGMWKPKQSNAGSNFTPKKKKRK
jgi:hypothetical protein